MSKESKPRDLWAQVFSAAVTRPTDFCTGCGYFHHVKGYHRADCTAKKQEAPDFRRVCQLTGTVAHPETSGAGAHTLASDGPAPDPHPLSGAGHTTN